jgi:hypothetical protein
LEIQTRRFTDSPLHLPITISLLKIKEEVLHQLHNGISKEVIIEIHLEVIGVAHGSALLQRNPLSQAGVCEDPFFPWMLGSRFEGSGIVRLLISESAPEIEIVPPYLIYLPDHFSSSAL